MRPWMMKEPLREGAMLHKYVTYNTENLSKLLNVRWQVHGKGGREKRIQLPSASACPPSLCRGHFMGVALFGSSLMEWSRVKALWSLRPRLKLPTMIWS